MTNNSNTLIYAPELEGHPRVYLRVICDCLRDSFRKIVLAVGENDRASISSSVDLHPLHARHDILFVRTNGVSRTGQNHLTAEELRSLQIEYGVASTLLIEAEKFSEQFVRIARGEAPKLIGRTLGIFAKTAEWFPGEDSFTGEPQRLVQHSLRRTLSNVKRALLNRKDSAAYFYKHFLLKRRAVDFIITKDERLASQDFRRVLWMPEISRINALTKTEVKTEDDWHRERELLDFKRQHPNRKILLYFGDAAFYKGYDLFLELLSRHEDLAGVHAGRLSDQNQRHMYVTDTVSLRRRLLDSGRLLATNDYVSSEYQKLLYFSQIELYATTHRLALSSSTMLQAAELGKPLLVPDRGLLGYRVSAHGLGETYRYGNVDDLYRKLIAMSSSPLDRFRPSLEKFSRQHSFEEIGHFWRKVLHVEKAC